MVAGVTLADLRSTSAGGGGVDRAPTALVIGLGGGALPMALRRMYPHLRVLAVELEPEVAAVAQEHFGLIQSDHLKVQAQSGSPDRVCWVDILVCRGGVAVATE